jgi:hypothetical protein
MSLFERRIEDYGRQVGPTLRNKKRLMCSYKQQPATVIAKTNKNVDPG